MRLERYINRLLDTLYSRGDWEIEELEYDLQADSGQGFIAARVRYWNGSLFEFDESLVVESGLVVNKVSYAYHYEDADHQLVFRYDNTPHHPNIATTFPHHKHIGGRVQSANAPDLHEVLQEIDQYLRAKHEPS